ncbi:hypothetical protein D7D52_34180 [Nocardia yunnanensis]|uniref:Alkyl sulfatase C-terminal domain-containing protein n=1 Tax=Nocardia yunnanensis TaxID=2382165 RepID=A0A386ZN93_9NOCA|nr:alkyl sulfatase C-terminal domain-containing protein [Nocardia yunnanensis]AYF78035.1 hypothetical protein D7D52_34180 [Nocardia yunnanensis]
MGGAEAVLTQARKDFDAGEYRWVAELLDRLVFAEPDNDAARELLADTFEQLGHQCENGTWRNEYLTGAMELRNGVRDLGAVVLATPDVMAAMTLDMLLDYAGIHLDGPRAWARNIRMNWTIREFDGPERDFAVQLSNGALIYTANKSLPDAAANVHLDRGALQRILFGTSDIDTELRAATITVEGDPEPLTHLFALLRPSAFWFPIVTP